MRDIKINLFNEVNKLNVCNGGEGSGLEAGPDVDCGSVVLAVAEALSMLKDLVSCGGERQGLLQLVSQSQGQFQVLLQMLERQVGWEVRIYNGCKRTIQDQ